MPGIFSKSHTTTTTYNMNNILLSGKELAAYLNHERGYVSAMMRMGYRPAIPRRHSVPDALEWLAAHRDFTVERAYPSKRRKQVRHQALAASMLDLQTAAARSLSATHRNI